MTALVPQRLAIEVVSLYRLRLESLQVNDLISLALHMNDNYSNPARLIISITDHYLLLGIRKLFKRMVKKHVESMLP